MQQTFEHLLGLPVTAALGILSASGVFGVQVIPTAAPPRCNPSPEDALRSDDAYASVRVVAVRDDGRTLIVSRFLTADPRQRERSNS